MANDREGLLSELPLAEFWHTRDAWPLVACARCKGVLADDGAGCNRREHEEWHLAIEASVSGSTGQQDTGEPTADEVDDVLHAAMADGKEWRVVEPEPVPVADSELRHQVAAAIHDSAAWVEHRTSTGARTPEFYRRLADEALAVVAPVLAAKDAEIERWRGPKGADWEDEFPTLSVAEYSTLYGEIHDALHAIVPNGWTEGSPSVMTLIQAVASKIEGLEEAEKLHRRQLLEALGMNQVRDWDDIRNAAAGIRKDRDFAVATRQQYAEERDAAVREVDKLKLEIQGYQVGDGYQKGHEHGSSVAARERAERNRLQTLLDDGMEELREIADRERWEYPPSLKDRIELVSSELEKLRKSNSVLADGLQRSGYAARDILQLKNDLADARAELDALKAEKADDPLVPIGPVLAAKMLGARVPDTEASEQAEPSSDVVVLPGNWEDIVETHSTSVDGRCGCGALCPDRDALARHREAVLSPATQAEPWKCGECKTINSPWMKSCELCSSERDDVAEVTPATPTEPRVVRTKKDCFHPWPGCNCPSVEVIEDVSGSASTAEEKP